MKSVYVVDDVFLIRERLIEMLSGLRNTCVIKETGDAGVAIEGVPRSGGGVFSEHCERLWPSRSFSPEAAKDGNQGDDLRMPPGSGEEKPP